MRKRWAAVTDDAEEDSAKFLPASPSGVRTAHTMFSSGAVCAEYDESAPTERQGLLSVLSDPPGVPAWVGSAGSGYDSFKEDNKGIQDVQGELFDDSVDMIGPYLELEDPLHSPSPYPSGCFEAVARAMTPTRCVHIIVA